LKQHLYNSAGDPHLFIFSWREPRTFTSLLGLILYLPRIIKLCTNIIINGGGRGKSLRILLSKHCIGWITLYINDHLHGILFRYFFIPKNYRYFIYFIHFSLFLYFVNWLFYFGTWKLMKFSLSKLEFFYSLLWYISFTQLSIEFFSNFPDYLFYLWVMSPQFFIYVMISSFCKFSFLYYEEINPLIL